MSTCFVPVTPSHAASVADVNGGEELGSDEGSSDFATSLEEESEDEVMMHIIKLFLP